MKCGDTHDPSGRTGRWGVVGSRKFCE